MILNIFWVYNLFFVSLEHIDSTRIMEEANSIKGTS